MKENTSLRKHFTSQNLTSLRDLNAPFSISSARPEHK